MAPRQTNRKNVRLTMPKFRLAAVVLGLALSLLGSAVRSQAVPSDVLCGGKTEPAFCGAVRGARAEGWPAQSRSEVMAQHGMVVTSQPLAAQAGLQMLMRGGNAIDEAVAARHAVQVCLPESCGR